MIEAPSAVVLAPEVASAVPAVPAVSAVVCVSPREECV
jgi:hypothetical protein